MSVKSIDSKPKKVGRSAEPLIKRFIKELKRIRWTSKKEGWELFKTVIVWTIALSAFFFIISLITNKILGIS